MAPRKGKGRQAVRNNSGGFPGWGYAVIGILAGAIMMAVVMRGSLFDSLHKPDGPQANPQATAESASDPGVAQPPAAESAPLSPRNGTLSISPLPNGPLRVAGPLEVVSGTGHTVLKTTETYFCRCGASAKKPYCDGSHARVGFKS